MFFFPDVLLFLMKFLCTCLCLCVHMCACVFICVHVQPALGIIPLVPSACLLAYLLIYLFIIYLFIIYLFIVIGLSLDWDSPHRLGWLAI